MRILVESLKRLYNSNKITKEAVNDRVVGGKITEEEYEYITGESYSDKIDNNIIGTVDEEILNGNIVNDDTIDEVVEKTIDSNESEVLSENETE